MNLRARGLTVPCYVRALELAVIEALAEIGIEPRIDRHHVGVWTARGKIAAIGVAQRHGVTLHGFAVNLQPDLAHFELINPCGLGVPRRHFSPGAFSAARCRSTSRDG